MTFNFNNSIPAAGNNPSNDQPIMLLNNQSTESIIAVDHIGFNVGNSGQHKKVTFNVTTPGYPYTPLVFPVTPPVLFAKNDAFTLAQMYFYSGTQAQSADQYVAATNGSNVMMGGIIMKWGSHVLAAQTDTVVFSTMVPPIPAFPNTNFNVSITIVNNNGSGGSPQVTAISATGFTVMYAAGATIYFTAIGN